MDNDRQTDVIDLIQRRAEKLAAEVELQRGVKRATSAVVIRAAETIGVVDAADTAQRHGRPVLAWLLRRFVAELRTKPVISAVEEEQE